MKIRNADIPAVNRVSAEEKGITSHVAFASLSGVQEHLELVAQQLGAVNQACFPSLEKYS